MLNQKTDDLDPIGFINKQYILSKVTQEEIFSLVFNFIPVELSYVTSPFRLDTSPGCWFEYLDDGVLRFKDFGNPKKFGRIKLANIDCFDAVQAYFKLPNFYQTLRFIKAKLIDNVEFTVQSKEAIQTVQKPIIKSLAKKELEIFVCPRKWNNKDAAFWKRYHISKDNLIEDQVFPISKMRLKNTKSGNYSFTLFDPSYAYTEFKNSRKKIYRPFAKDQTKRFITNCTNEDVGSIKHLVPYGRQLIISKSYKDRRVLKNFGLNSVWFQNEGQFPNNKSLSRLVSRFDKILVFFDNDSTGIQASKALSLKINSLLGSHRSNFLYLPESLLINKIKDPSDLVYKKSLKDLQMFLEQKKIL